MPAPSLSRCVLSVNHSSWLLQSNVVYDASPSKKLSARSPLRRPTFLRIFHANDQSKTRIPLARNSILKRRLPFGFSLWFLEVFGKKDSQRNVFAGCVSCYFLSTCEKYSRPTVLLVSFKRKTTTKELSSSQCNENFNYQSQRFATFTFAVVIVYSRAAN